MEGLHIHLDRLVVELLVFRLDLWLLRDERPLGRFGLDYFFECRNLCVLLLLQNGMKITLYDCSVCAFLEIKKSDWGY